MARQSSLVPQLRAETALAAETGEAEDTTKDQGECAGTTVRGNLQHWHYTGEIGHAGHNECARERGDIAERRGQRHCYIDEQAEEGRHRSGEDCCDSQVRRRWRRGTALSSRTGTSSKPLMPTLL